MSLFSLLFKRDERVLDHLAQEIARRCRSDVHQHLSIAAQAMTLNEVQGYVRSRVAMLVRREAAAALARRGNPKRISRQALAQRATDYVVPLVVRQLPMSAPIVPAGRKAG